MPLACFLNGLTRPVREIKNRTAPKGAGSAASLLDLRPHPYRVRPQIKGLSHGLEKCPLDTFLPRSGAGLSSPTINIKNRSVPPRGTDLFLVPLTGLEPVQYRYRGILSPLCLPIPPQRRVLHHSILTRMRQENHPGGHASRMGFVISAAGDIYSCAGSAGSYRNNPA